VAANNDLVNDAPTPSRRRLLTTSMPGALAGLTVPVVPRTVEAAVSDADVLNFALNLEYLEAEFYLRRLWPRARLGRHRRQPVEVGGNANIVPTDADGIAFGRSTGQVLNIVYLGGASARFGFFPNGLTGRSAGHAGRAGGLPRSNLGWATRPAMERR
jgi:hypothetical protein